MEYYIADFETTVYEGQTDTQVWAAAIVPLKAPDEVESVTIYHTINEFMYCLTELCKKHSSVVYFHNLKFDGSFIMNYLKNSQYWKQDSKATYTDEGEYAGEEFLKSGSFKMTNGYYRYSISDKGMWYSITLKIHNHTVEIRDSAKLLPFSVEQLGIGFNLKHRKLEMEYTGFRYPGCDISDEEKVYIAHDVLVVKEALEFIFSQGHDGLTIGACCLAEYKKQYKTKVWNAKFPNIYNTIIEGVNIGDFVRKSYKGGWCYVVPEKAGIIYRKKGTTCDCNSLYSSQMHSNSGNRYPVGLPTYFKGNIPSEALQDNKYYFVHVRTRFYIKPGMLPTIMIKDNIWYPGREWLRTSDVINMKLPKEDRLKDENRVKYIIENGQIKPAIPDLYLTMTDWELLQKHYDLEDTEIIDGCYFDAEIGLFDDYINKYAEIKEHSKGPMRQLSKLFLNNLSGKFATGTDSSYKVAFLNEAGELRTYVVPGYEKTPGYIPIGSAITSYARAFTITAAQANYYGPDKPGFIYADTDSIHCDLEADQIKGCPEHPTKLNHWKYEASWDFAKFVRPKTYVEHVYAENEERIDKPYYNMKCAGMSEHVKDLFLYSVEQNITPEAYSKLDADEQEFVNEQRTFDDFKVGLSIPGMLKAKQIKGGVLLCKSWYKMHNIIEV